MIDAKAFGEELAGIVKAATAPLLARIEALEGQVKAVEARPAGLTAEALAEQVEAVEARVKSHADETMRKAMERGFAAQEDGLRQIVKECSELYDPELPDIPAMVADAVEEAVKSIPAPQDGKDGAPGERGEPGRDGLDVKDLFRADGGRLVAVMSDGSTKDLGVFVGKDGEPGQNGADGKDGADGLGFEDMDFEQDEHGRVTAKFQRGDLVKSVRLPGIVDRGPFKVGEGYEKGDAVSYGGSLWIAQEPTGDKPDGSKAWRLAVKKGRDARGV